MSLMLAGSLAAGAASGAASGLMGGKEEETKKEYHPLQETFVKASQSQIPLYLQMITGGMPTYMKRYLQQTRGLAQQQARGSIQEYLRNLGRGGMDFGPAAAAGLSNIFGGINQNVLSQYAQQRNQLTQQGLGAMREWAQIQPGATTTTKEKVPGVGRQAAAGALGSLGGALGQKVNPKSSQNFGVSNQPAVPNASLPVGQQGPVAPGQSAQAYQWLNQQVAQRNPFGIGLK
jgi:hypothetical protein